MSSEKLEKACEDAIHQIEKNVREFTHKLDSGTKDPEKFISFAEIESLWASLSESTNKTYSDMISAYLSDLDEKALIQSKKEYSDKGGSG
ncbi:MAG: hypothetical protein K6G15_04785 [Desulfovibrio sp.]|nr:hypothetical protein [Desulfovibrio sp.]